MNSNDLNDSKARIEVEKNFDDTLYLEAGAGTGKTTRLVNRIIAIILNGKANLQDIAVITFTEAAASELLDRIREYLEIKNSDINLTSEQRKQIQLSIDNIESASIQTLHSFAADLVRQSPIEAGITPGFEVSDEFESELLFQDFWNQWKDEAVEIEETIKPFKILISLGIDHHQVLKIAKEFWRNYDLLEATEFPDLLAPEAINPEELFEIESELNRLIPMAKLGNEDPLIKHMETVFEMMRLFSASSSSEYSTLYMLKNYSLVFDNGYRRISNRQIGKQSDWDTDTLTGINGCKNVKEILKNLQEKIDNFIIQSARHAMMPIVRSLQDSILVHAKKRKLTGTLLFHDLLVYARNMLKDNLQVRNFYRNRFKYVLIDEFQDTDPIQAEIATFICEDASMHENEDRSRNWKEITTVPGKLFAVGDPKQSIFRFRRADINVGNTIKTNIADKILYLTSNFRSQKSILEWVNKVFSNIIIEGANQPHYVPLHASEEIQDIGSTANVFHFGTERGKNIHATRQLEANDIPRIVSKMFNEQWHVRDMSKMHTEAIPLIRPIRLDDICILSPTRFTLMNIINRLEDAAIPYRLESAFLMYTTQEIQDVLNCFKAINNPKDYISVVATLKSPIFGCSDAEIFSHLQSRHTLNSLDEYNHTKDSIGSSLSTLQQFHLKKNTVSVSLLIEELFRERYITGYALHTKRVREQWRKYQLIIDKARVLSENKTLTLAYFITWIEAQIENDVHSLDSSVSEGDENAIRIMTIHRSKGLEFPVVFLVGISDKYEAKTSNVLFDRDTEKSELKLTSKIHTDNWKYVEEQEKTSLTDERKRLLYVAATRARDYLIVSTHRLEKDNSQADWIVDAIGESPEAYWSELQQESLSTMNTNFNDPQVLYKEISSLSREQWKEKRSNDFKASRIPALITATGLVNEIKNESLSDEEPWKRGRSGTAIGRAVHAILQTIEFDSDSNVNSMALTQSEFENIPQHAETVAMLVRNALSSPILERARKSKNIWREVSVMAPIERIVAEGIIDLVFEEDDGLVIVDYKTDNLYSDKEITLATDKYQLQILLYAYAINKATGKVVKEAGLLFLRANSFIGIENPKQFHEQAESAIAKYINNN